MATCLLPLLVVASSLCTTAVFALEAAEYGVKGNGATDDTQALRAALKAAADAGGGQVRLPLGQFRLDGSLTIPSGVTLRGAWDTPHDSDPARGSVLLAYGGRGREDGPPLLMLESNSAVVGLTIFYPEQDVNDIQPYPWTIQGRGTHLNVSDVTLLNPYRGIDFATHSHEMHYIRNVYGCPLKVGVSLDKCTDIGRVENVHFNPNSWTRAKVPTSPTGPAGQKLVAYLQANCTAFEIGRSDWEYMFNTFSWGCHIGYRFYSSEAGPTNGNFLGIAADWAVVPLLVEETQQPGLLITNGEFVGSPGSPACVKVANTHTGVLQLANCSFWGPHEKIVEAGGTGTVSLSQCNFVQWDHANAGAPAVDILGGSLLLQACRFGADKPQVHLGPKASAAVIMGNLVRGALRITNETTGDVQVLGNVTSG